MARPSSPRVRREELRYLTGLPTARQCSFCGTKANRDGSGLKYICRQWVQSPIELRRPTVSTTLFLNAGDRHLPAISAASPSSAEFDLQSWKNGCANSVSKHGDGAAWCRWSPSSNSTNCHVQTAPKSEVRSQRLQRSRHRWQQQAEWIVFRYLASSCHFEQPALWQEILKEG